MEFSFLHAARQVPRRIALVHGEESWTFRRLADAVVTVMASLQQQLSEIGLQAPWQPASSPRIALVGESTVGGLLRLYALMELGLPVVLLHPRWTPAERLAAIQDSQACLVLSPPWPAEPHQQKNAPTLRGRPQKNQASPEGTTVPSPENWLALVYTSGTTGSPKAGVLRRGAFLASARASAENLGWHPRDRWLLSLPIAHVGGLSIVTRCLAARRCVVLEPSRRFEADAFADSIRRHRVTLASLVPTMLHRLLEIRPRWQPPKHLRAILLGGAAAAPELLRRARERHLPLLPTYGLTEACSQVATQRYGSAGSLEAGCGPPLAGIEVRTVKGIVQVRGATLMEGYLPLGEEPSPFEADGWFSTGDLGRLDEAGNLHLSGRRRDLIITGGENVYPTEVEGVLLEHGAVREACVFGIEDPHWGQIVAAALVAETEEPPVAEEILRHLQGRLAAFKHPRQLRWLDSLPLGANGKVDSAAVRRAAAKMPAS